jgi:hypothetical protein
MQRYELAARSIPSDQVTLDHLAACAKMHPELVARLVEWNATAGGDTRRTRLV